MMDNIDSEDVELKENPTSQFAHLYKATGEIDQNKRRQELLNEQKRRREAVIDTARGLEDVEDNDEDEPDSPSPPETGMEKQPYKKKFYRSYHKRIMLSEWLIDIPPDFDVSWFMKICPEGHRNILVARNNQTKAYSRQGKLSNVFQSLLPGGSIRDANCKRKTTVVDCIWSPKTHTFYVLDVLIWGNSDLTGYDAEFRFFWLDSRMSEIFDLDPRSNLESASDQNIPKFCVIPHMACDHLEIKDKLDIYPCYENNRPAIDGLLFYHKEASYTSGYTPLVGWLKPYMVPEILSIPVCSNYLVKRPKNYVNLKQHIQHGKLRRKKIKEEANAEMETS